MAADGVAHDIAVRVLLGPLAIGARDLLSRVEDAHAVFIRTHLAGVLEERVMRSLRSRRDR